MGSGVRRGNLPASGGSVAPEQPAQEAAAAAAGPEISLYALPNPAAPGQDVTWKLRVESAGDHQPRPLMIFRGASRLAEFDLQSGLEMDLFSTSYGQAGEYAETFQVFGLDSPL